MNKKLVIDINNYLQKMTEKYVKPMYGIRDDNSIQSIVNSLDQEVFGIKLYPTVFDKATYLWYALTTSHCFYNGNKRTALATTFIFLRMHGYYLGINNNIYEKSLSIAKSELTTNDIKMFIEKQVKKSNDIVKITPLEQLIEDIDTNLEFKNLIIKLSKI